MTTGLSAASKNPYLVESYLQQLLQKSIAAGARDIHLKVGQPPGARVRGDLVFFRLDPLTSANTEAVARHLIKDGVTLGNLDTLREYDSSYEVEGLGRFRVNVYRQRSSLAVVLRVIPEVVPSLEMLGAPPVCQYLAERERGLVLCVGAAGNGKSSTLAAMVDHMNKNLPRHIVTIEDPIEFVHRDQKSSVSQREVGLDTKSFASALRAALRQDPDVIHVGEIRDQETMKIALEAAETGHLVLSTLHTPDVARTMNRILSLMEGAGVDVRERVGDALQGIIAQRLLPRADGQGMALAAEVLIGTGSVKESIRRPQGNPSLKELMTSGADMYGMQTFDMAIRGLAQRGLVTPEVAKAALSG
ncbi:MAG TPA: PilT/PilU family type 4a pilus ATPase [Polyangiaceae bacterium]|nr:PilT/PilU family type 4a pilus ATPase [Polyangiaceae bacterium]